MYTDDSASMTFPAGMPPETAIQSFDAAWNARDVERVLKFFAADAVVRFMYPPPFPDPDTYTGQDEIRKLVTGYLRGKFQILSRDYKVSGEQVTWRYNMMADRLRDLGVEEVDGAAGATFSHGKIQHFTISFSPNSTADIVAGLDRAGIRGPISEGMTGAGQGSETPAPAGRGTKGGQETMPPGEAGTDRPHRGPTWQPTGTEGDDSSQGDA